MAIPTYDRFIEPLLRFLASRPDGVSTRDVYPALADVVGLTDAERDVLLPSGRQRVYRNRIGWAQDRLKRARLSRSPKRGLWQLTDAGQQFVADHPEPLGESDIVQLAKPAAQSRANDATEPESSPSNELVADGSSPDERIEQAIGELNESLALELLDLIGCSSPLFFENLVLHVLHALGYGASRADLQQVGGSADRGIDGIISLDRLGLEKVYVQAKRWQNNVGRPEIQGFVGALSGQHAKKGVFITLSGFTREARDYASQVSDSIVLIDGSRLTRLMIEHGVGVTHRPINIAHIDSDYFEELD